MLTISNDVERIQNTVLFFLENTHNVGITKLCKLLYFADVECYVQTGFSITKLEYLAQKNGPVPVQVWNELKNVDMPKYEKKCFIRDVLKNDKYVQGEDGCYFVPKKHAVFDGKNHTPAELRIMRDIADKYRDATGTQMSNESHLPGKPWSVAWKHGAGRGSVIDFNVALDACGDAEHIAKIKELQRWYAKTANFVESL